MHHVVHEQHLFFLSLTVNHPVVVMVTTQIKAGLLIHVWKLEQIFVGSRLLSKYISYSGERVVNWGLFVVLR